MPYVPRPATTAQCAHCGGSFEKKHASRRYCSNSCNVQASYARTGYREGRATRADLEQALARMTELVELVTGKPAPAAKAAATKPTAPAANAAATKPKPAKKAVSTSKKGITTPTPAAKAAATKPKKKITAPAPRKDDLFRRETPEEIEADIQRAGKQLIAQAKRERAELKRKHGID
jgi:hypothetical protein